MSLYGLTKGISLTNCILCVCVIIDKRSFEHFCVWILFLNASSHPVSDFCVIINRRSFEHFVRLDPDL